MPRMVNLLGVLSALGRVRATTTPTKVEPPPVEPKKCLNQDCEKLTINQFCSADCSRYHKANFRAENGYNVRITDGIAEPLR